MTALSPPSVLLQHKLAEVRVLLCDDDARLQRVRARLSAVESKSLPLLLSLTSELSAQTSVFAELRARLSSLQSGFSAAQMEAAAVYASAVQGMDAQFELSLVSVEAAMREAMSAVSALRTFEEAEAELRQRSAELEAANRLNEERHRARLSDMEERWNSRRRAVRDTAVEVRRRSELQYKQQLMRLMLVDTSTIATELDAMEAVAAKEEAVRVRLLADMHSERRVVEEEREAEREERGQRAGKAEALLQLRLAVQATRGEAAEEERALAEWSTSARDGRAKEAEERRLAGQRAEEERAGWLTAVRVERRELQRLRADVRRLERLKAANPFHQLSLECLAHCSRQLHSQHSALCPSPPPPAQPPSAAVVRSLTHPQRLSVLQLLFASLHEAEQRREAAAPAAAAAAAAAAVQQPALCSPHTSSAEAECLEVVEEHCVTGSFFLTQQSALG